MTAWEALEHAEATLPADHPARPHVEQARAAMHAHWLAHDAPPLAAAVAGTPTEPDDTAGKQSGRARYSPARPSRPRGRGTGDPARDALTARGCG